MRERVPMVLVVDLLSMAGITANRNPQCDSSETVRCIFQSSHKTIKILRRRKNRQQGVDHIRTVLFAEFIQILFAVGVTVLGVDAHWCWVVNESNIRHRNRIGQEGTDSWEIGTLLYPDTKIWLLSDKNWKSNSIRNRPVFLIRLCHDILFPILLRRRQDWTPSFII